MLYSVYSHLFLSSDRNVSFSTINEDLSEHLFSFTTSRCLFYVEHIDLKIYILEDVFVDTNAPLGIKYSILLVNHWIGKNLFCMFFDLITLLLICINVFLFFVRMCLDIWSSLWCWNTIEKWSIKRLWIRNFWKACIEHNC